MNSSNMTAADKLPLLIEVVAQGSGIGKSLVSERIRDHLRELLYSTAFVKIESQRLDLALRPGDIHIASEEFARSGELVGGLVGVVKPLFAAIEKIGHGRAIIVDWPSGLAQHRRNIVAATLLDHELKEAGVAHHVFIVTTKDLDRMREAQALVKSTAEDLPSARVVLVLNDHAGTFEFARGSIGAKIYDELVKAVGPDQILAVPLAAGLVLQTFAPLGRDLSAIEALPPREVAAKLGLDRYLTNASLTHLAAFTTATGVALSRFFPGAFENDEEGEAA